jgi:hypothetical protein
MAGTGSPAPVILIGRCTACQRPFRVEIPAEVAERFGGRMPYCLGLVLQAAGITVSCDCRSGPCPPAGNGNPACGDSWCEGHGGTAVRFTAGSVVKVTYKPEKRCGGSCWSARSSNCTCSCEGENHGGAWQAY